MKSKIIFFTLICFGIVSCSEDKKSPNFQIIYSNSNQIKVEGTIENYNKIGQWNYYYLNGKTLKTLNYSENLLVDSSKYFDSTGVFWYSTQWKIIQDTSIPFRFSIPNEFETTLLSDSIIKLKSRTGDYVSIYLNQLQNGDNLKSYLLGSIEHLNSMFDSITTDARIVNLEGGHSFGYNQYQIIIEDGLYYGTNIIGIVDDNFIDITLEYKTYHREIELLFFDLIENLYFNKKQFMNPNDEFLSETKL